MCSPVAVATGLQNEHASNSNANGAHVSRHWHHPDHDLQQLLDAAGNGGRQLLHLAFDSSQHALATCEAWADLLRSSRLPKQHVAVARPHPQAFAPRMARLQSSRDFCLSSPLRNCLPKRLERPKRWPLGWTGYCLSQRLALLQAQVALKPVEVPDLFVRQDETLVVTKKVLHASALVQQTNT